MRLSRAPLRLLVGHLAALIAELRDDAAHERDRVVQVAQDVHEIAVIQAETGELLDHLDVGHLPDHLVIDPAQRVDERVLLRRGLDRGDDLIALLPLRDEGRYQFDRILEVAAHRDRAVAVGLADAVVGRVELSEVPRVEDGLDPPVSRAHLPQVDARPVRRAVVDEQDVIVVLRKIPREHLLQSLRDLADVLLFVIAGYQHTDLFHDASLFFRPVGQCLQRQRSFR